MSNNRPPNHPQHAAGGSIAAGADANAEVARLINGGKAKQAVELAKEHHKRVNTSESEKLLVDAYVSRIGQFQAKSQVEDAATLIKLVRERFPAHAGRLGMLETTNAATGGLVDQLVAPLARADLPDEQREVIETAIRQKLLDLQGLAECKSLPAAHPLKVAATAVWRAFEAATTGPVADELVTLPEVSRRSPLVGWRMLVRAIAAFHRNDDENCRRALEAIPADAAVHRLVPVLLGIMTSEPPGRGAVGALQVRINNADEPLRQALGMIDTSFDRQDLHGLIHGAAEALRTAETARPELSETLRQRLAARCISADVPMQEVNKVLGSTLKDATFWRMLARGYERASASILAALAWERFLCHAISEKMFDAAGLEAGIVYLHMAEILAMTSRHEIEMFKVDRGRRDLYGSYYRNQPPHIVALKPKNPADVLSRALSPEALFRDAARILPDTDTFKKWSLWSRYVELPVKNQEDILLAWQRAQPRDLDPILRLSVLAEERDALQIAMKRLAEAEAIDPLNPAVRKARVRLILATLWRHTKDHKAHLVEKDLAQLEAISAFNDGDHNAFLWACKSIWHLLRNDVDAAKSAADAVIEKMGPLAGSVLLNSVAYNAHLDRNGTFPLAPHVADPEPLAVGQTDARMRRLGTALSITILRPVIWDSLELSLLGQKPSPMSIDDILTIGAGASDRNNVKIAYAASSAGLQKATGAMAARFLLMRAINVQEWSRGRAVQCIRAALDLARQVHDDELMKEITDEMSELGTSAHSDAGGKPLEPAMLADILASERKAVEIPTSAASADKFVVLIENDRPFGGGGGRGFFDDIFGGEADDDEYDDDDEDDEDEDGGYAGFDFAGAGIPAGLMPILSKVILKYGRLPTPMELQREDPKMAAEIMKLLKQLPGGF